MENIREHRRLDIIATEKQAKKLAAKTTFRSFKRFHENLLAVERYKCIVHLKKNNIYGFLRLGSLKASDVRLSLRTDSILVATTMHILVSMLYTATLYKHLSDKIRK